MKLQSRRSFLKQSAVASASAGIFAGLINTPGSALAAGNQSQTTQPGTTSNGLFSYSAGYAGCRYQNEFSNVLDVSVSRTWRNGPGYGRIKIHYQRTTWVNGVPHTEYFEGPWTADYVDKPEGNVEAIWVAIPGWADTYGISVEGQVMPEYEDV